MSLPRYKQGKEQAMASNLDRKNDLVALLFAVGSRPFAQDGSSKIMEHTHLPH